KRSLTSAAVFGADKGFSLSGLNMARRRPPLLPSSAALPECITQCALPFTAGAPHDPPDLFLSLHLMAYSSCFLRSVGSKSETAELIQGLPFLPKLQHPVVKPPFLVVLFVVVLRMRTAIPCTGRRTPALGFCTQLHPSCLDRITGSD